jgi:hypothetical protein
MRAREKKVEERIEHLVAAWMALRELLGAGLFDDVRSAIEAAGRGRRQLLNMPDERGQTLLHSAIDANRVEEVRLLLECGADANYKHNYRAPLEMAAQVGSVPMLKMLLRRKARLDERSKLDGYNALMVAIFNRRESAALYLIERGIACGDEVVDGVKLSCIDLVLQKDMPPVAFALYERGVVTGSLFARAVVADARNTALALLDDPDYVRPTARQREFLLKACRSDEMMEIVHSAAAVQSVRGAIGAPSKIEQACAKKRSESSPM